MIGLSALCVALLARAITVTVLYSNKEKDKECSVLPAGVDLFNPDLSLNAYPDKPSINPLEILTPTVLLLDSLIMSKY